VSRTSGGGSVLGSLGGFSGAYALTLLAYLGVQALAARILGTADYGLFILALTTASLVGRVGTLGMNRMVLRDTAVLREREARGHDVRESWVSSVKDVRIVTRYTLPAMAVVCGGAAAAWRWDSDPILGLAVALVVWGSGEQHLWAGVSRGLGATALSNLIEGNSGQSPAEWWALR